MIERKKAQEEADVIQAAETAEDQESDENAFEVKISVKIGSKIIEQDIDQILKIPPFEKLNGLLLSDLLAENPSLHARWNYLFNQAIFECDTLKTEYEIWLSRTSSSVRRALTDLDSGRVTDRMVDDALKMDPEYKRYNDDLSKAKRNLNHIKAVAIGIGEKGEKLVNIASLMKWEMENLTKSTMGGGGQFKHIAKSKDRVGTQIEKSKDFNIDPDTNGGWPTKD